MGGLSAYLQAGATLASEAIRREEVTLDQGAAMAVAFAKDMATLVRGGVPEAVKNTLAAIQNSGGGADADPERAGVTDEAQDESSLPF